MDKKTLELAKQRYKQKTGLKKVSIKPTIIKGTRMISDIFVLVNGKRKILADKKEGILIWGGNYGW